MVFESNDRRELHTVEPTHGRCVVAGIGEGVGDGLDFTGTLTMETAVE